jgi:Skp family chaperone for outer membrane proteins
MKNKLIITFLLPTLLTVFPALALEIPLTRGGEGKGGVTVGYVDMEAIYQEYPETQKAKEEYYIELENRRQILAERDKEGSELREKLMVLRTTLVDLDAPPPAEQAPLALPDVPAASTDTALAPSLSTAPAAAPTPEAAKKEDWLALLDKRFPTKPSASQDLFINKTSLGSAKESIRQQENLLARQESQLDDERKTAAQEMKNLEQKRSMQIFGKLYKALVQLADEKGLSLVVDKSSILYGQTGLDLTDSLRRRIRGLPEPVKE